MVVNEDAPKRKSRRASMVKAVENIKNTVQRKRSRSQEYEVETILSHDIVDGEIVYKVTWVGYPGEITELTAADLKNCSELVQSYWGRKYNKSCFVPEKPSDLDCLSKRANDVEEKDLVNGTVKTSQEKTQEKIKELNGLDKDVDAPDNTSAQATSSIGNSTEKSAEKSTEQRTEMEPAVVPAKRTRRAKQRPIAPDAELGYNNGCIVNEYKGFSTKYIEPVVLVTYKEPLPKGFEDRQDEIVPIRIVAEKDPKKLIAHLVDLLSNNRAINSH